MNRRGYIMKCTKCNKEYDLVKATDRAVKNQVKCPNCQHIVGTRNS